MPDTAETLAAWAEFYGEFPECLPDEWTLLEAHNGRAVRYARFADQGGKGHAYMTWGLVGVPEDMQPPDWFLTLALGTLREMLEAKGWYQFRGFNDEYEWDTGKIRAPGPIVSNDCPHLAAQAAWRAMKGNTRC